MRGLYKFATAPGRWWGCAEDTDGSEVCIIADRYELMGHAPPLEQLPLETDEQKKKRTAGG